MIMAGMKDTTKTIMSRRLSHLKQCMVGVWRLDRRYTHRDREFGLINDFHVHADSL